MEENNTFQEETPFKKPSLTIPDTSLPLLAETGRWGNFLAILGFIGTGLMVLVGLFAGSIFSSLGSEFSNNPFSGGMGIFMGLFYALIGLVYFFPSLYLYRFSDKIKKAIIQRDSDVLASALENQKSLYKFMGVFCIVSIGLYVLIFVFAMIGGAIGAMM
ncbi:DUF5362 family protein [Algoriphagus sp. PAP.12]|uniref:DUF5362 family protein n=1 Tax=Algoriphagus sp. PAP.12 TaxID=2996678 RepID=UPI00227A89CE|nr:DUF5362 family protein [Algoriphagus sp. PAP.12]